MRTYTPTGRKPGRPPKYPWHTMAKGECFRVPMNSVQWNSMHLAVLRMNGREDELAAAAGLMDRQKNWFVDDAAHNGHWVVWRTR